MDRRGWLRRLAAQLPGWFVWYGGSPGAGWMAVPAPPGTTARDAREMPHRIGPFPTPQELRAAARARYAWDDHCQTCGNPWQDCGHRAPETRERYWPE